MKRLGDLARYRKGKPPRASEHGRLPVLSPHYLRTGEIEEMAEPTPRDVVLNGGELILLWDGSNAGEFFRARAGVLSSTMVVFDFDPAETNPDYLYFDLKRFEPELKGRTSGSGIPHVDKEILLAREICERSPDEQRVAADVLLKIELAIEQTEALLAKQHRIRAGLMENLLMRGLDAQGRPRDPSTHPFKSSRFGMLPSDWDVVEAGRKLTIIDPQPDHRTPPIQANGCPYIGIGDITAAGTINVANARKVPPSVLAAQCASFCVHPGAFIYGKIGTLGVPTRIPTDRTFAISANVVLFTSAICQDISYAFWVFSSPIVTSQIADASNSTSQPALGIKSIRAVQVPWPRSSAERAAISDALTIANNSTVATEQSIRRLCRIRTGLMDDLLTGRVPVTPLLPDSSQ